MSLDLSDKYTTEIFSVIGKYLVNLGEAKVFKKRLKKY